MIGYTFYERDSRLRRYAEALVARGDSVDVIALGNKDLPSLEVIEGVRVYRIQKRLINEKSKGSYFWRILKFLVNSALFVSMKHLGARYDLIHVHSVPDFEVFAALLPKLTGAKIILDIHDIVPEFYASKFHVGKESLVFRALLLLEKISIRFSDHVIIANHLWEKKLTCRSVAAEKCTTFLNYPDRTHSHVRSRKPDNGRFVAMYPGSLNWHQGLDIAIKAFAIVRAELADAEFHIYGKGPEENALRELVSDLGLRSIVSFRGFLPLDKIYERMAEATVAIVPKRNDPFGGDAFSTKVLEFMSLGIPIVLSKTRIDSYYFRNEVVEFFDPEDCEDLARSIVLLARDEKRRRELSANALKFVEKYYWEEKKEDYFSLIDKLLNVSPVEKVRTARG